ncbi:MAG: hypothetical protein IKX93_02665 [Bacteroidaceae bacterium]|nr:hypothetical protein [Bacteroidaceae bacterium]
MLGISLFANIMLAGVVCFYEVRTHNVREMLTVMGVYNLDENKRPGHYFIVDWAACVKKLNYKADVAFFGNSITADSNFQNYFTDVKIAEFGLHGDRIDGMIRRLPILQSVNPDKVFVMAGINDLHRSSPETIAERYDKLLNLIQDSLPNAKIYVQSILPVNRVKEKLYASNDVIKETNVLIEKCAKKHNCKYIDLNSVYIENGVLPDSLSYDGVHLTQPAYDRLAKMIKSYIYE